MISRVNSLKIPAALNPEVLSDLQTALYKGSAEMAVSLLKKGNGANHPLPNGEMPLHYAIRTRDAAFVKTLVESISFDYSLKDHQGFTPVDHAQITKDQKMLAAVVCQKIGSSFKAAEEKELSKDQIETIGKISKELEICRSFTPTSSELHTAAATGDIENLAKHFNPKNPDKTDSTGLTALQYAARHGQKEAFNWLLQRGCSVDLLTKEKASLLHLAVIGKNEEIIAQILKTKRLDPNGADNAGRVPLHYAMIDENLNMAQALIQAGADPSIEIGGYANHVSPLETMAFLAKKWGEKKDPLKIAPLQAALMTTVAISWVAQLLKKEAPLGYLIVSLISFLYEIEYFKALFSSSKNLASKIFAVSLFFIRDLPGINFIYRAYNTYYIGKEALNGVKNCWKNRHLDGSRSLKNAILHTATGAYLGSSLARSIRQVPAAINMYKASQNPGKFANFFDKKMHSDPKFHERVSACFRGHPNRETFNCPESFEDYADEFQTLWDEFEAGNGPRDYATLCQNLSKKDCILKDELDPTTEEGARFILGLKEDFTTGDCKRAFRKEGLQFHPDKNKDPDAGRVFIKVAASAETLGCGTRKASQEE